MNAASVDRHNKDIYSGAMRKPAIYSALLHVLIFLLGTLGLPHFVTPPEPMETVMTVELVDLSNISQTNVVAPPDKSDAIEPPAPRKPVYNNSNSAPDLLSPKEPEIEDVPMPPDETAKPDLTQIKEPPKPKNKPKVKPKPTPPPVKDKPEEKPKDDQNDMTSLLKSLITEEAADQSTAQDTPDSAGQTSQIAPVSAQLLSSMEASLNNGIRKCWNVDAGGKNAETQIVKLQVFVNRDRTVQKVEFIEKLRYETDTYYKAAAEAARRALMNPACWPLQLPEEQYEVWKSFPYTFDPSGML